MGYQGLDFTWTRGMAQARLDRFIYNSYWDEAYPISIVSHLLRLRSDHRPILLQVGNSRAQSSSSRFRYFSGWLSHEDFHRMVSDNWCPKATMTEMLINYSKAADLLRQKYKLTTLLLVSIHRASCTPLWCALSKYWDVLRNGIAWSLRPGNSIQPLTDTWIPSVDPLCEHLKHVALLFPIGNVSDLLDSDSN
ncbi:hypothetical protein V6N13_029542 [Hibiscus sabdariffa]